MPPAGPDEESQQAGRFIHRTIGPRLWDFKRIPQCKQWYRGQSWPSSLIIPHYWKWSRWRVLAQRRNLSGRNQPKSEPQWGGRRSSSNPPHSAGQRSAPKGWLWILNMQRCQIEYGLAMWTAVLMCGSFSLVFSSLVSSSAWNINVLKQLWNLEISIELVHTILIFVILKFGFGSIGYAIAINIIWKQWKISSRNFNILN